MKKPPSAACRLIRRRRLRRWLRSYQCRFARQLRHWLKEATTGASQKSRLPPDMVSPVSPASKKVARGGIDLGGTKIQTVIVDAKNQVLGESRRPTPTSGGPEDVTREMSEALAEAAAQAKLKTADLAGVGVGSPGDADEQTGVVSDARNLPNWIDPFPLAEKLSEATGTQIKIGNDVSVAVQGEFELGAGK